MKIEPTLGRLGLISNQGSMEFSHSERIRLNFVCQELEFRF